MDTDSRPETQGSEGEPRKGRRRRRGRRRRGRGPTAARRIGFLSRFRAKTGRALRNVAAPALRETRGLAGERLDSARGPLARFGRSAWGTISDLAHTTAAAISTLVAGIARPIGSAARGILAGAGRGTRTLAREVTPIRALVFAIGLAVAGLIASQFVDYRAVAVGAPDYSGVGAAAPAPLVNEQRPTSAHGVSLLVIAGLSAVLLLTMLRSNRWQLGRLIGILGLAAIAIALIVDIPASRELDAATRDYTGASPELLGGFWAQLGCGATLLVCGMTVAARGASRVAANPSRRRSNSDRIASAPEAGGATA